jgi:hypothetical protein
MSLAQYVHRMCNQELIGLAKNRFIDVPTQEAIAKHPYRRAKTYLASNSSLCPSVAKDLWDMRGYTLKCELIQAGTYKDTPDKYRELYYDHQSRFKRSPWKMLTVFLRSYYYGNGPDATPPDIIEQIYKDWIQPADLPAEYSYFHRTRIEAVLRHPNCTLDVAVKISTTEEPRIRKLAFEAISRLSP